MTHDEIKDIAELECRKYFDAYLNTIFPQQIAKLECAFDKRTDAKFAIHDTSPTAHGGVQRRFDRVFWLLLGLATGAGGGVGAGAAKLISLIG
jgi:hypothetical protein